MLCFEMYGNKTTLLQRVTSTSRFRYGSHFRFPKKYVWNGKWRAWLVLLTNVFVNRWQDDDNNTNLFSLIRATTMSFFKHDTERCKWTWQRAWRAICTISHAHAQHFIHPMIHLIPASCLHVACVRYNGGPLQWKRFDMVDHGWHLWLIWQTPPSRQGFL